MLRRQLIATDDPEGNRYCVEGKVDILSYFNSSDGSEVLIRVSPCHGHADSSSEVPWEFLPFVHDCMNNPLAFEKDISKQTGGKGTVVPSGTMWENPLVDHAVDYEYSEEDPEEIFLAIIGGYPPKPNG